MSTGQRSIVGSPATIQALGMLEQSYTALALIPQATDARKLREAYLASAVTEKLDEDAKPDAAPAPEAIKS